MNIRVFIQNEAGSHKKHYHDETTLTWKRTSDVSLPYPYPYGFIIGTAAEDGCNVDCFVITHHAAEDRSADRLRRRRTHGAVRGRSG
jgi:inorganic pyrophosphatase